MKIGDHKVTSLKDFRLVVASKLSIFQQPNRSGGGLYYAGSGEDKLIPPKWTSGATLVYEDHVSSYVEASSSLAVADVVYAVAWLNSMTSDESKNRALAQIVNSGITDSWKEIRPTTLVDDEWTRLIRRNSFYTKQTDASSLISTTVPELSTALLGGVAVIGMLFRRRK